LTQAQATAFVNYWYGQSGGSTGIWYVQIDAHGGKNGAVSNISTSATSYAHRNFLFLYQFYEAAFFGSFPSSGFSYLQNFVGNVTATMKASDWGQYINYADSQLNQTTAQQRYWGDNLPRLQSLKALYDPQELFYYPQSVRPASS
jgi:hypothetical protein